MALAIPGGALCDWRLSNLSPRSPYEVCQNRATCITVSPLTGQRLYLCDEHTPLSSEAKWTFEQDVWRSRAKRPAPGGRER